MDDRLPFEAAPGPETAGQTTPSDQERLSAILDEAALMLDDLAGQAANRAFNLGCFSGLVPGAILLVFMLAFTGLNVIGGCIALLLTMLAMVAFANLAAAVARGNTARRVYAQSIEPFIKSSLEAQGLSAADFYDLANKTLADGSLLRSLLPTSGPEI
jgi:hypothetical protein